MIKEIDLKNFKCFEQFNTKFKNLNVLTGLNGMGKSTVIQSLLLLRQTYEKNYLSRGLILNGDYLKMGGANDILNRNCRENDDIGIKIKFNKNSINFSYKYSDSDCIELNSKSNTITDEEIIKENLFDVDFCYLSAERIGPRQIYEKSNYSINVCHQIGINGEMSVGYLIEKASDQVGTKNVVHPVKNQGNTIEAQLNSWLSEISPGATISLKEYTDAHKAALNFRLPSDYGYFDCNAINVGFGLSYVLPVILALLKAKAGDLVIIENPEAHLHPSGQRKIGELISRCASGGVQIIIETHSDHILNGLRLGVKKQLIKPEDINLIFFSTDEKFTERIVDYPCIELDGSLNYWPNGFFDEWDKAIDEFFI